MVRVDLQILKLKYIMTKDDVSDEIIAKTVKWIFNHMCSTQEVFYGKIYSELWKDVYRRISHILLVDYSIHRKFNEFFKNIVLPLDDTYNLEFKDILKIVD